MRASEVHASKQASNATGTDGRGDSAGKRAGAVMRQKSTRSTAAVPARAVWTCGRVRCSGSSSSNSKTDGGAAERYKQVLKLRISAMTET